MIKMTSHWISFFVDSVTQRANHARDYLLEEGLEKIDGYVVLNIPLLSCQKGDGTEWGREKFTGNINTSQCNCSLAL